MSDGWHDDPFGRYPKRYYDGTQWTHHVADHAGTTQADPMGTQPNPAGAPTAPPVSTMPAGYGTGPKKSGAVLRFLARLIDGVIIGVPLYLVLGAMFDDMFAFDTADGADFEFNFPIGALILQIGVYAAYDIYMHGTFGRTIGKMVVGVTVVTAADGSKIDYGMATVRFLGWLIYYIPFIGWILFIVTVVKGFSDPKGQTIHDSIAKTMVASSSSVKG